MQFNGNENKLFFFKKKNFSNSISLALRVQHALDLISRLTGDDDDDYDNNINKKINKKLYASKTLIINYM